MHHGISHRLKKGRGMIDNLKKKSGGESSRETRNK
jgi:hypothetical protein